MVKSPLGEIITRAMDAKGLSREEVVRLVGYYHLPTGLQMLDDLISGKASAYRHTPMANLPEVLGISREEFDAALTKKPFRPYLWIRSSRSRPMSISIVAFVGEAAYKYVPLPEGLVAPDGSFDPEAVGEIIRAHYRESGGKVAQFGDIVSYLFHWKEDGTAIEFSPDGSLLTFDPEPPPQVDYILRVKNKVITKGLIDKKI